MKRLVIIGFAAQLLCGCGGSGSVRVEELPQDSISLFTSSDSALENAFAWAKEQALFFAHDGTDSVGYWYEAALPRREAFCMRDVSHQTVGAQLLGLQKHNHNMLWKFASNISESKDWCSYWEINRYDKPAPVDYANDKEFWYNLPANLDVVFACNKMYEWTGDESYLKGEEFVNFYDKTINKYVNHWMMEPDSIMLRPLLMHSPEPFDERNGFHVCRGLASYVENFSGLSVSLDLLASLYAGHKAYAQMLALNGDAEQARKYQDKAQEYQELMETKWWNDSLNCYNTFWTTEGKFYKGEGVPFALWFGAVPNAERLKASVADILSNDWNVENLSYFPAILYRLGYNDEAYKFLLQLSTNERKDYPEASYGWIEGLLGGYMGLDAQASTNSLSSLLRSEGEDSASVRNVPVWNGYVSLSHSGHHESRLENRTRKDCTWNACFQGHQANVEANGKPCQTVEYRKDVLGNEFTVASIKIANNDAVVVTAK